MEGQQLWQLEKGISQKHTGCEEWCNSNLILPVDATPFYGKFEITLQIKITRGKNLGVSIGRLEEIAIFICFLRDSLSAYMYCSDDKTGILRISIKPE